MTCLSQKDSSRILALLEAAVTEDEKKPPSLSQ